jgi:3-oxoacyl-[acyl-carrier-protein] synthase-3
METKKLKQMNIGIDSYGLFIPQTYESAEEIASRIGITTKEIKNLGIQRKYIPGEDDHPVIMAVKAAEKAFKKSYHIEPENVDVVIWTGEEYKDYIAQTASIRLQEEVGCRNAYAFDLVAQGVTMIQGLRLAKDIITGDETVHTILLAGGTRNIDLVDEHNPHTRFMLPFSASGSAVLLRRDPNANRLTSTAFRVDPEMADDILVPGGGTESPFSPQHLDSELMFYHSSYPDKVEAYLNQRWPQALVEIAQRVCVDGKPDYLALRHLPPSGRDRVLKNLGLRSRQSEPLFWYGHHGTNDIIISIDLALKRGVLKNGDKVAMVTGGIGFTYAAALVEWGPLR